MITEFIVTDADVGLGFPSEYSFLVGLVRSRGPAGDCYSRPWMERHFILRDEKSPQNLFCLDATTSGKTPLVIGGALMFIINNCIPFFGALRLVCVPAGSEWEVTLSDVYVAPRLSRPKAWWYGNYKPRGPSSIIAPPLHMLPLSAAPPLQIAGPVASPIEQGR